ncbi:MAG: (Fe-S)-binding protein [Chloroflexaceae bacterium]|nr:(Fe-S)-binding protein [Chloroflexaceae bacterium]
MLTLTEKIIFLIVVVLSGSLAVAGFTRIFHAISRGHGGLPSWETFKRRVIPMSMDIVLQRPIFKTRPLPSLLHAFVFFAFGFYALVNVVDVLEGFVHFSTTGQGGVIGIYNLIADVLSFLGLAGMAALLLRRFVQKPFAIKSDVLLLPEARRGIARDSLIVGTFILTHLGARWVGQAFHIAETGAFDPFQPTASVVALGLSGASEAFLTAGMHVTWWLAIGLILLFLPYFTYSKHIHLMVGPLNWIMREDRPMGRLEGPVKNGHVGANQLQDLRTYQIMDAYACIMCNRCQDACPAYLSGRPLSPAALEINKRYFLNQNLSSFAGGDTAIPPMLDMALPRAAIWSCTTCAACVNICPMGNRPMLDIIEVRRYLVNEGDELDANLQAALESFGRQGNSFNKPARQRAKWAKEVAPPIKDARKEPVEYLWFVGDYASYDPRIQENTQAVAQLFHQAGLDFGILYDAERNAGNDVRRVGEEGLFEMLVEQNMKAMEKATFQAIVTTDPHSYNTLKNEYREAGLKVPVYHYTEILDDLLHTGKLTPVNRVDAVVTYHDPCYLARYNRITAPPRRVLSAIGARLHEMERHGEYTHCCGAGGGCVWMESAGEDRPSVQRIREAATIGEDLRYFVVACPKDMAMYSDAVKTAGYEGKIEIVDIASLVLQSVRRPPAERTEPEPLPKQQEQEPSKTKQAEPVDVEKEVVA